MNANCPDPFHTGDSEGEEYTLPVPGGLTVTGYRCPTCGVQTVTIESHTPGVGAVTLTEFLLARIAEDEAYARECSAGWDVSGWRDADVDHLMNWADPARVLAECEAKRRVVDWAAPLIDGERYETDDAKDLLALLAAVHSDHPDYHDEWKP